MRRRSRRSRRRNYVWTPFVVSVSGNACAVAVRVPVCKGVFAILDGGSEDLVSDEGRISDHGVLLAALACIDGPRQTPVHCSILQMSKNILGKTETLENRTLNREKKTTQTMNKC